MPSDDLSSSQNLNKPDASRINISNIVIKKTRNLLNTCPINTVRERLPQIEEKCVKKLPRKNKISCSDLSTEWLKPGVSLPKLRTKSVISKRPDAGEPYTATPESPTQKKLFDCFWVSKTSLSSFSPKCSQFEEDVIEDDYHDPVGPSKCQFMINIPSSELVFDAIDIPEEYHEPSHALQLWEIWMKKRKRMQDVACKKLNRKPHDLIINQNEIHRKILEDKTMFAYAQLPEANFWEAESKTKKHKSNNPFHVEIRRKESTTPEMEFIDIPRVIDIEKGYFSEEGNKVQNKMTKFWDECPYRRERSQFFKKQRSKLRPNEIDVNELAVVGKQIYPIVEVEYSKPDSTTDTPKIYVHDENEDSPVEDRKSIACLVIDGIEIKREFRTDYNYSREQLLVAVEFGVNKAKTFVERSITVENKGTMAISYSWAPKKPGERLLLQPISQGIRQPWFFFNKNSGIFLPGQIYHLKFYHHTRNAGNQTEIWFLKTLPELFPTPESCRFILTAMAEDDGPDKEVIALRRYLDKRVGESFVKKLLDEIMYQATHPCTGLNFIEYRCFFLEKNLFEFHNPKHHYHASIVTELKYLFNKVCGDSQQEWDLSLSTLIKLTMANTSGESRNSFLSAISESSKKLFRPNYLAIRMEQSRRMAYQILCKMTSFIETDYSYFRKCLSLKKKKLKERCKRDDFEEASTEEYGEVENDITDCPYCTNASNFAYFQRMIYTKVYQHLCDAAEHIADIIETHKFLQPTKNNLVNDFNCF